MVLCMTVIRGTFRKKFRFSHLLIRGLIKKLSPSEAIFITFSVEKNYYIVHVIVNIDRNILKALLKFSNLLIVD